MDIHRLTATALMIVLAPLATAGGATAQSSARVPGIPIHPEREAYYGDLHLHTSYSLDAYLDIAAQVDPDGAYRFARGEPGTYLNEAVKRSTPPLDFLTVTDHAEWVGVFNTVEDPNSALSRSEIGKEVRARPSKAWRKFAPGWPSKVEPLPGVDTEAITRSVWHRTIDAANRHYQPGQFTTFIAYEWTSSPDERNLHRNVIFRGDKAPLPFTALHSSRPEDLWRFLEQSRQQGYQALAIPHNSNYSKGSMFDWVDSEGRPIDQAYAERRAAHEPLVEIAQHKGQSETRPVLSSNDEFANFELLDQVPGKAGGSYVRDALGRGLTLAQRLGGVNPYQYGFVGASDFHNGLSEAAEQAYAGTAGAIDPTGKILNFDQWVAGLDWYRTAAEREQTTRELYQWGAGALTGVWAEQNTREAIFAALRRKETFATSGTRLKFRFFGGWEFTAALLKNTAWVTAAYRDGVPMGGELPAPPAGTKAPTFVVWAVKDPDGANLDRLQIVKLWLQGGQHVERVYDVALSNGRTVNPKTGKAPPVGNTVNVENATYRNTIGATELSAVWQDPHFDPAVPAVYYLRVLEIPTPRWSTIAAVRRGEPRPAGVPATIQERGWSSPIWFSAPAQTGKERR